MSAWSYEATGEDEYTFEARPGNMRLTSKYVIWLAYSLGHVPRLVFQTFRETCSVAPVTDWQKFPSLLSTSMPTTLTANQAESFCGLDVFPCVIAGGET